MLKGLYTLGTGKGLKVRKILKTRRTQVRWAYGHAMGLKKRNTLKTSRT